MPCFSNWRMCFDVLLGSTHPEKVANEGLYGLPKQSVTILVIVTGWGVDPMYYM